MDFSFSNMKKIGRQRAEDIGTSLSSVPKVLVKSSLTNVKVLGRLATRRPDAGGRWLAEQREHGAQFKRDFPRLWSLAAFRPAKMEADAPSQLRGGGMLGSIDHNRLQQLINAPGASRSIIDRMPR